MADQVGSTPLPPIRPRRRDDLAWRDIDGRVVVVDAADSQLHDLCEVATFYWALMDGTHTLDDLVAAACEEFDVDPRTARSDLDELVDVLAAKGLLESTGP